MILMLARPSIKALLRSPIKKLIRRNSGEGKRLSIVRFAVAKKNQAVLNRSTNFLLGENVL